MTCHVSVKRRYGEVGDVLRDVSIPAEVATCNRSVTEGRHVNADSVPQRERARLERELDALHRRMDAAYMDKLNGKISDDFWQRKQADWESEDARLKALISELKGARIR